MDPDPDKPIDDLQALWQDQPAEPIAMVPAELHAKAEKFRATIAARNTREWLAAAIVAVLFTINAIAESDPIIRAGDVIVTLGAGFTAWYMYANARGRALPSHELPSHTFYAFYRDELARQRDLLRRVWWWYLGPMVLGFAVISVGRALSTGLSLWAVGFVLAIFAGVGWLNNRGAAELQRQIDALPIAKNSAP